MTPPAKPHSHKAWHSRGYLPHFDAPNLTQMITFRLADSPSQNAKPAKDPRLGILRDPDNAAIVHAALTHFDAARYQLRAWVVMPDHVHVLIEQQQGWPLGIVVQNWKSTTAKAINRRRGTTGTIWAPDYFDRFIRNDAHYAAAIRYIEDNPVEAGLVREAADWPFSSASSPREDADEDAGGTPALLP